MTFDRDTRNALAGMVKRLRERLRDDNVSQLRRLGFQESGEVLDLNAIPGLAADDLRAGKALRLLFDHITATEGGKGADRRRPAFARMAREIGFTTLNRLLAIRMAEERGLIRQAVGAGYESAGFRVYEQVAGGALGDRHETYRAFLESLYDELAVDLPALFTRDDPRSWIFPTEQAMGEVFTEVNAGGYGSFWKEDEAIGWVYQYYNDPDERRQMRKHGAPRNSRELAVRNQFFTPRYVVEFLTDNTLGRTWYEMQQGNTRLGDQCRYLVRRPDEVFLSDSNTWPSDNSDVAFIRGESNDLGPFVPPRAEWNGGERRKDGVITMPWVDTGEAGNRLAVFAHFLRPFDWQNDSRKESWEAQLVALVDGSPDQPVEGQTQDLWDLLLAVVRADRFTDGMITTHATALTRLSNEIRHRLLVSRDPNATQEQRLRAPHLIAHRKKKDPRALRILDPACGSGHFLLYAFDVLLTIYDEAWDDADLGPDLQREYGDRDRFLRRIPALILHHNLYGIDIDPRACQIAALALWLRAHRHWQELKVKPVERPQVRRSHIVCAEPMPGEREMLREYLRTVDPRLQPLVEAIWDKMQLAGEAGSLLKIEGEIRGELARARSEAMVDYPAIQTTMVGEPKPRQQTIEFASKDDITFWHEAEEKVLQALSSFATQANDDRGVQRRLFADDAAEGFAFIDICRLPFDVVLMNPPFGEASAASKSYIDAAYPRTKNDVFAAFVERWLYQLGAGGQLGAITSRTVFFLTSFQKWREEILLKEARPTVLADLGSGVLDAMVETAAYCLERAVAQPMARE